MQPDIRTQLGTNLFYQLEKLKQEKGRVNAEDAGVIVASLIKSGNHHILQKEIVQMIKDIDGVKNEILTLSTGKQTNKQAIADASLHLDTVIKSTEEATGRIMDAVEAIGKLAVEMGGNKEQELRDICTRIYEACSFQDLISQRITKVNKLIHTLEAHIKNLLTLFDMPGDSGESKGNDPMDEKNLLNGPALPEKAISQADVDSLFKSLGE